MNFGVYELLMVWLILGVVAGVIASRKGNSFWGYLMVGLLLGPLGVLVAAVSPRSAKSVEYR
jgi:Kef-type K+ transport system membrane component KefB